jgi:hypothetical protein
MFKLPFGVTFESLKMEFMQILHAHLLGAAVALVLVGISAAFLYYANKPKAKGTYDD